LAKLEAGQLLKVLTTDKAARMDLTVFCQQTGHVLHAQTSQADSDVSVHYIQKRQA
jgi:TusA-related sulfurtransferase